MVSVNEVGSWEGFIWHLGGSDATGGTTAADYEADLNSILAGLDDLNGRGADYPAVICAMGSRTSTAWDAVMRIRRAAANVAAARAQAVYAEPRDVTLADAVHQDTKGNMRLAHSMSRHLAAAEAGAQAGPVVSSGSADGNVLTLSVTHAPGGTDLVGTGDWKSRIAVYPAGYVPTADNTGRLTISSAAIENGQIKLTLPAAPTADVDVYLYPHPDTTGATLDQRLIEDNYTADGVSHGRQVLPTTFAPVTIEVAEAPPVDPPASELLPASAVMLTAMDGATPAFAAAKFGQGQSTLNAPCRLLAPGPVLPASGSLTMTCWFMSNMTPPSTGFFMGERGRVMICVQTDGRRAS